MASQGATPAAATWSLRRARVRDRDELATAAEAPTFPELVWAHYMRQRELHDKGELHGPAEAEYRRLLDEFTRENGPIINAYWCTNEASAVALTERKQERVAGFLWRSRSNIRLHTATDWMTAGAPILGNVLHTAETLAIRVSEVLSSTSERIGMQWILSLSGSVLGVVDQAEGKPSHQVQTSTARRARAELAQIEAYYDRAGQKAGRLIYFWGMMVGAAFLAVIGSVGALVLAAFGGWDILADTDTYRFFVCYAMGAVGAIVSVMIRMASNAPGQFNLDYEVGRQALRRVGSFRPVIGAIFAVVFYFSLQGGLIHLQTGNSATTTYFYAALAFATGFSERKAKVMLGGAERILTGEPEEHDSKPKPAAHANGARKSEGGGVD
jgi:hypothetical protein